MIDKIQVGDIVRVDFNCSQCTLYFKATVLHIPCAIGDSWIFKDIKTEELAYVSEGCTVIRIKE